MKPTPTFTEAYAHAFLTPAGDRIVFPALPAHPTPEDTEQCPSGFFISEILSLKCDGFYKVWCDEDGNVLCDGIHLIGGPLGPWSVVSGPNHAIIVARMKAKGTPIPNMNDPAQRAQAVREAEVREAEEEGGPALDQIPPQRFMN